MSSDDSKSLTRAYERDIPGYRAASSPALQKRKASHTLAPSNLSQSKKHRSSSGDEADIGPHSLVAACSHLPQEVSEPTTPKTPIRESFPSADQLDPQVTPRANKTTATEDPVAGSPPTTPTRTTSGTADLESGLNALSVTSGIRTTPLHASTGTIDSYPTDPLDSGSRHIAGRRRRKKMSSSQRTLDSNASNNVAPANVPIMEAAMKTELYGAVFLYEGFYDDFLGGAAPEIHSKVRKSIESGVLKSEGSRWSFNHNPFTLGDEKKAYAPLAELLNVIGQAVYGVCFEGGTDQFRQEYRPFSDQHSQPMGSDYPSDAGTKPDLVKAKRPGKRAAHWGDVEMVVECKSHNTQGDQNEAYLQLARYARGIFSHQIYRLHVFGVAVCGPTVTFVRFDRSGLLHSPDIDLSTSEGADAFVHHMISLLSLSALDFGYDPRYTFEPKPDKSDKRSDTLLALDGYLPRIVSSLLCHRKCCRGRATMASCLAATSPADTQVYFSAAESDLVRRFANQEIAHKKIWRHEERTAEGTTLQRFRGVFGVCQVIAFWDNVHTTKVKYPSRLRYSRAASYFIPTSAMQTTSTVTSASTSTSTHTTTTAESNTESAEVSSKPTGPPSDSSVAQSETESSQSGHSSSATSDMGDTDAPELLKSHTDLLREVRIASDLLMPKGRPLSDAQSALHVAYAMHDTLLGIMAFAEAGLLHCDISAFNILLVNPEVHYQGTNGEWNRPVEGSLGDLTWNSLSSQPLPEEKPGATNMVITDSQMRQGFVDKLKRGPYAVLCDVEHTVNERRSPGEIHRDRTGTPAFISAQLLMDPIGDEPPVGRSFIHDLESLMWVLIWVAAHQSPSEMNAEARKFVRELSQYELDALGRFKVNFIRGYLDVNATISQFGNTWSTKLAPIIQKMAAFFAHFLYPTKTKTKAFGPGNSNDAPSTLDAEFADFDYNEDDDEVQRNLQKHLEYMEQKRWKSFMYFLGLFHYSIRELSQEEHVDLAIV